MKILSFEYPILFDLPLPYWINQDATPIYDYQPIRKPNPDCGINLHTEWQKVQIQISWPTDLGLHCLQRQDITEFSKTRVKKII